MKTAGQVAWEAASYIRLRDWNLEGWPWEDVPESVQKTWEEMAEAVIKWHERKASDARVS